MVFVIVALIPFIGLAATMTAWVANPLKFNPRSVLHVVGTRPVNGARNFLPNGFVAADVHLPNKGKGVDARTISAETVKLYRAKDRAAGGSVGCGAPGAMTCGRYLADGLPMIEVRRAGSPAPRRWSANIAQGRPHRASG